MTCFYRLSSIALIDKAFFKANRSTQLVYILYLYINKSDLIVPKDLFKSKLIIFHLLNNNFINYNWRF